MDESVFLEKRIERTADGSATIFLPKLDEHYHSVKGAYAETRHVYVECGLHHCDKSCVRILEVGFGTGLNAIATAMDTGMKTVEYFSIELYPIPTEDLVGYHQFLPERWQPISRQILDAQWNTPVEITPNFTIHKMLCDLIDPATKLPNRIDVVYFDAFAPEKQPEMWSNDVLKRIANAMNHGGILTTYCAKGEIRRRLQSLGLTVERLPGPPNGKREILRATLQ